MSIRRPELASPFVLQPWRRLPAYVVNGIAVAIGIGCIQLIATASAGSHAAALLVSGAVCASIADTPNAPSRTWHRVGAAALLSGVAAVCVDLVRASPHALGAVVMAVAFSAMMVLAWGARAGAVSFAPVLATVFAMAVPPAGHELAVAGWGACGAVAYLGWSLLANAALQRRYRTLAVVAALRAAAELFRSRARLLVAYRVQAGEAPPLGTWIGGEAALADRLQAARDLVYPALRSPQWQRDVAIVLRLIDLRDALLTSRLDVDLLGTDARGRDILEGAAHALLALGKRLDGAADALRDGTAARAPSLASPPSAAAAAIGDRDSAQAPISTSVALADARARLLPVLQGRLDRLADDVERIHRLLEGEREPLPLTAEQLQSFVAPEGWPLRALRPHWRRDSPVLRHAVRMSLALGTAYYLALVLPWATHPYWVVLSVAVVLRGSLGDTLARRNARVFGTVLGCLLVVGLSHLPSAPSVNAAFLAALATAHSFVTQRYWVTATAASVMALLQSHLVNPQNGFAIGERIADTFLGAILAWCFSYVLPSWERRSVPDAIGRALRELSDYAAHSLRAGSGDVVEERLARRRAYESLAAVGAALSRSRAEPRGVRLPIERVAALLDHGERFMAHLSLVRHSLARLDRAAELGRVDAELADAVAAMGTCLDLASTDAVVASRTAAAAAAAAGDVDLLPARPPTADVVPWLARRLAQLVREAIDIRAAAKASLAGAGRAVTDDDAVDGDDDARAGGHAARTDT